MNEYYQAQLRLNSDTDWLRANLSNPHLASLTKWLCRRRLRDLEENYDENNDFRSLTTLE